MKLRVISRILACLLLLSLFAGCGTDGEPAQTSSEAVSETTETVPVTTEETTMATETTEPETTEQPETEAETEAKTKAPAASEASQSGSPSAATPTEPKATEPSSPAPTESSAASTPSGDLRSIAMQYIGSPVASLYAAIGYPSGSSYASSCNGPGEDGELYYSGFTVYTYRENGVETVVDVY